MQPSRGGLQEAEDIKAGLPSAIVKREKRLKRRRDKYAERCAAAKAAAEMPAAMPMDCTQEPQPEPTPEQRALQDERDLQDYLAAEKMFLDAMRECFANLGDLRDREMAEHDAAAASWPDVHLDGSSLGASVATPDGPDYDSSAPEPLSDQNESEDGEVDLEDSGSDPDQDEQLLVPAKPA